MKKILLLGGSAQQVVAIETAKKLISNILSRIISKIITQNRIISKFLREYNS